MCFGNYVPLNCRHLSIPFEWQDFVMSGQLTSCYSGKHKAASRTHTNGNYIQLLLVHRISELCWTAVQHIRRINKAIMGPSTQQIFFSSSPLPVLLPQHVSAIRPSSGGIQYYCMPLDDGHICCVDRSQIIIRSPCSLCVCHLFFCFSCNPCSIKES
jgi:hypothetical protein